MGAAKLKTIVTESKQGLAPSLTMNGTEKFASARCAGLCPSQNNVRARYAH
jgi:hypothetical protein